MSRNCSSHGLTALEIGLIAGLVCFGLIGLLGTISHHKLFAIPAAPAPVTAPHQP